MEHFIEDDEHHKHPRYDDTDIPGNSFADLLLGMAISLGCGLAVYFGAVTAYNIWRSFYG